MPDSPSSPSRWLNWARQIQAHAQNGLAYCQNPFDIERYNALLALSSEILADLSSRPNAEISRLLDMEIGPASYTTPKVDVRGAAFQGDQVLLVQEMQDGGRWTLPGGWMDAWDTPGGAVAREFWEETGYIAEPLRLAAVYDRDRHGHPPFLFAVLKLFFVCEIRGGQPTASHETGDSRFFPVNDLPEVSIGRVTHAEIQMLYRHYLDPSLPVEFDR